MSNELANPVIKKVKKKSLFKRWWFWVLSTLVLIIIISTLSSGDSSTIYELSKMTQMNKQEILDKFGKPDEIVRDDNDRYSFGYDAGFIVSGTAKGANEIELREDAVKKTTSDSYKVMNVELGASFDENVKTFGAPNNSISSDGKKGAMYLTEEDFLLVFMTGSNSDNIASIRLVEYTGSQEAEGMDITKMLGSIATEDEIKKVYTIKNKGSEGQSTLYELDGFNLVVENKNNTVTQAFISKSSIYNINGIRTNDTLEMAEKVFGKPINSIEGVKNTVQYTFEYNDEKILISADSISNKIGYMEVSPK